MADVLCPNCGRPNSDHREFCDFCGNPLDGALRVEGNTDSPLKDSLDPTPESLDDASRLDSLVPAPEQESPSSRLDDFLDDEPLNGDSRLESLLADDLDEPTPDLPDEPDPLNGGSRLDAYLPVDEPAADKEPEAEKKEESSWLDEYMDQDEPEDRLRLTTESLYKESEDDSSRLDDYLTPETPPERDQIDESSRLDDFFADDPFKSPDPFQEIPPSEEEKEDSYSIEQDPFAEPPAPADQTPPEEPFFSRDDLLDDSPLEGEPPESDFMDLISETELPAEKSPPESGETEEWDFLEPAPGQEQPEKEKPPEAIDPGVWDFLDPAPSSEQPEVKKPPEAIDPGEWDFLDPAPSSEQPEGEKPSEAVDPGKWDYLDPASTPDEPEADQFSETIELGEWDSMDPASQQSEPESSPESTEAGEWDFLDPPSSDADQEKPSPDSAGPEAEEDWSFLDPGPTADLLEGEREQELEPMTEGEGEDAGWLDMLQDPGTRQETTPESGAPSEPQKPQTDWLEKIRRLNQSSDLVDEDSSFPDWLAATGKTAEFAGEHPEESDEVPDWLGVEDDESLNEFLRKKDLTNEEYKPKITTDSLDETEVPADMDGSVPELSDSQQIKFPSWAEEERKKEQKRKETLSASGSEKDAKVAAEPLEIEEEFFDDLFTEELPGWLTAASSEDVRQTLEDDLAQGELPGWVEAMRPVVESADASGLDEDEEYIENYGPLAGIPSVLPAEAEIGIDFDKAVQKPLDLLATKKHQENVDLLKKLIGDENKSKSIQLPAPPKTQRVLRWLIAIIMLVSIAGTLIFSRTFDAEPLTEAQAQGTGFSALYEEIEELYDGQPVLIAFDYQAATAGELHTAAATVVDHLMEQGTFLTFISTQPAGPALAEHFLNATQSHHNYIHTQKYINLGYLPGESAGLVSFMISPKKIIPLAFDGSNAWDSPPLISIDRIDDFKMILVITDDPNTAKIWIEQVEPRLDETPLTMVVSAQVEPLIQPYFRTSPQQLSGYVAGIIDSMNYENLSERPYLANRNWLPFNIGIVISVGIVFIGGLANGVLSLFSRRKDKGRGESK